MDRGVARFLFTVGDKVVETNFVRPPNRIVFAEYGLDEKPRPRP